MKYGARGITVCEEWLAYLPFRDWAMANGYTDTLTLDRRNGKLGYSPNNCRWITSKEQANNLHTNRLVTAFGETKTISGWADDPRCQVSRKALYRRIVDRWPTEKAITNPRYVHGLPSRPYRMGIARQIRLPKPPTHGDYRTRLYGIWKQMRYRPAGVSREWKNSYEPFRDWSFTNGYRDNLTLDRIDGTRGYSADNCRWATRKQQQNNLRSNVVLEAFGERKTLTEWSEDSRCAVYIKTISYRLRHGWAAEDAIAVLPNQSQRLVL
jgi:Zn-finger protein